MPERFPIQPFRVIRHFMRFGDLIALLTRREVETRHKGSIIGMGWSLIQPLVMLSIYTFVFSTIFKSRWGVESQEGRLDFALALFMGLITFGLFSEVANAAPSVILNQVNYVKKVVFPLEILPVVTFLGALVTALFSLSVLLVGALAIRGGFSWTLILLPVAWFPMFCLSLGAGFFLSSLGVFIRDIAPTVQLVTTMLFFLSPIFYPLSAVPEPYRSIVRFNPIAICVENARRVVLWGMTPDWFLTACGFGISGLFLFVGYVWFMWTKRTFADVV
ncbi:MAG: ABC transporter permease [Desulfococcaceae bacterium]